MSDAVIAWLKRIEREIDILKSFEIPEPTTTPTTATILTISNGDVSNPPTQTELTTLLGDPATVGVNKIFLVNDNGQYHHEYFILSDGLYYWVVPMTKAGGEPPSTGPTSSLLASNGIADADSPGWDNGPTFVASNILSASIGGHTYQIYAYWNTTHYIVFKWRMDYNPTWTTFTTTILLVDTEGNNDAHNCICMGIDPNHYLHIAYNHHHSALLYRMSVNTLDTFDGNLTTTLSMLGTNETSVTYPQFILDPNGKLYFIHTQFAGGVTVHYYLYTYEESTDTWSASTGTGANGLLLQGGAFYNAYAHTPIFDDTGDLFIMYTWCATSSGNDACVDLGCIKWDRTNWTRIGGAAQTMPVTTANDERVISITQATGLMNQGHIDIDNNGYPHIAYIKGEGGDAAKSHIYHAWYNGSVWTEIQITTADYASFTMVRPDIACNRVSGRTYIIYVDEVDEVGLLVQWADAPYTSWTKVKIYTPQIGFYEPSHDFYEWLVNHTLYIPMAYYITAGNKSTIQLLKWKP